MNPDKRILTEIINLFVIKQKRSRLLGFLESKKRYDDFLWELLHDPRNFDPKCIIQLPQQEQTPEIILQNLYKLGARNKCYIVSASLEVL